MQARGILWWVKVFVWPLVVPIHCTPQPNCTRRLFEAGESELPWRARCHWVVAYAETRLGPKLIINHHEKELVSKIGLVL